MKNSLDFSRQLCQGGATISKSGFPASVTSGFFVPSVKEVSPVLWRVDRAEYNTRKGNKPSVLLDVVETRHLINAAILLNQEEAYHV